MRMDDVRYVLWRSRNNTGPSEMEMDYDMLMEYERQVDMMREDEMMHRAYEEETMSDAYDDDI